MPHPLLTVPESLLLIGLGKGAAGGDWVNTQHSQASTSNDLLMVPSTYPHTRVSVHAPAQGESYVILSMIKIFSTNVGQDFQK